MSSIWTPERKTLVKARWAEGFSASQIAVELSRECEPGNHISRNAVIGIIHRMNLSVPLEKAQERARSGRNTFAKAKQPGKIAHVWKPTIVELPKPDPIGPMNDFPAHGCCRSIEGHPAIQDWQCCGHPVKPKADKVIFVYCEYHHALTHQPKIAPQVTEDANEPVPMDEKAGVTAFTKFNQLPPNAVTRFKKRAA